MDGELKSPKKGVLLVEVAHFFEKNWVKKLTEKYLILRKNISLNFFKNLNEKSKKLPQRNENNFSWGTRNHKVYDAFFYHL